MAASLALQPAPGMGDMAVWLDQRQALVGGLEQALRDGFQAVAAFQAAAYLDCIERQEALCRQIAALDRAMPEASAEPHARRAQVDRLRAMNLELRHWSDVQAALIEHGGRSVRCFQRVWALSAPVYTVAPTGAAPEGK